MEKIGLKAVLEMGSFQAGVRQYLSGIDQMTSEADQLLRSLQPVGIALAGLGAAGGAFIKSATMTAARTQELSLVLDVLATNARKAALAEGDMARATELSADAIDAGVQAIKDKGITTQVATKLTTQFVRYQLDMAQSTDLARVAQDAAVLSMQDSSEALDGLLHGILTYNPRVLRTYGITVQAKDAFEAFADANGLVAEELTSSQRAQAMLNAVLQEGESISGAYEAAMDSAGKRLRSLKRHTEEAKNALGEAFIPYLDKGVVAVTNLLKAFNELDPQQQKMIANMLGIGTVVGAAGGAFILLTPRILATAKAFGELATFGKDVHAGLMLMKEGAGAAQVATTGLAGTAAAAIPVLLALAAAATAAYKAYQLHQEIQERQAETAGTWTKFLQEQVSAGKSATEIANEYGEAQKRVAQAHEEGGLIADVFVNKQRVMNAEAEALNQTLASQSSTYAEYAEAISIVNAKMEEGETAVAMLTEAEYEEAKAVGRESAQRRDFYGYLEDTKEATEENAEALEELAEIEQRMADDQEDIAQRTLQMERDYNRQLVDMSIDRARQIEDIERNLAARRAEAASQLAQRLADIEAQGARQAQQSARDHAERMAEIEENYQERVAEIKQEYEKSMYEAISERDATAALKAMRKRDEELEEARRDRDEQRADAQTDYAQQQADQAANLEAQKQAARQAYQEQMADLAQSRQEQIEELDRSLARQKADLQRHNQWQIQEMRQQFMDEYREMIYNYAAQEALYAQHLANMQQIWNQMGGSWGLPPTGTRGFIGGYAEGGSFITGGTTTATFGEAGVPELVIAQPMSPVPGMGANPGSVDVGGTMRHEVSGAIDGLMSGFEGRLSGAVTRAVIQAFRGVLH